MRVGLGGVLVVVGVFGFVCSSAFGAVTPGWECVPATAGQAVTSGGTGSSPSCSSGTAVLAPTYVSAGVGGRPTVEFSAVNVQVVSGSGSTSGAVNGEGNLVVGYAENASGYSRAGSNDLVVGSDDGWSGYGELVGGTANQASGAFSTVFGEANVASGADASVTGGENGLASGAAASVDGGNHDTASGSNGSWAAGGFKNVSDGSSTSVGGGAFNVAGGANASIAGGAFNTAAGAYGAVAGGCSNLVGSGSASVNADCTNAKSFAGDFASVTGGDGNHASAIDSAVMGGRSIPPPQARVPSRVGARTSPVGEPSISTSTATTPALARTSRR